MIKLMPNIGNIVKVILSLLTLGGVILGGIKAHDRNVERKATESYIMQEKEKQRVKKERQQDSINILVLTKLDTLIQTSVKRDARDVMVARKVMALDRSYTDFLKATKNIDVLVKYLESEREEIKKNNGSTGMIRLEPSQLWIPYSYKYELPK
jgi:hypothetical protein